MRGIWRCVMHHACRGQAVPFRSRCVSTTLGDLRVDGACIRFLLFLRFLGRLASFLPIILGRIGTTGLWTSIPFLAGWPLWAVAGPGGVDQTSNHLDNNLEYVGIQWVHANEPTGCSPRGIVNIVSVVNPLISQLSRRAHRVQILGTHRKGSSHSLKHEFPPLYTMLSGSSMTLCCCWGSKPPRI